MQQIPNRIYDQNNKRWIIPYEGLAKLEELFQGELYYKTPRWKILNEPMPTVEFKLPKTYTVPKLNNGINAYNYQKYGYQFLRNKLDSHGFAILADGVGLGKTLISIMTFYQLFMEGKTQKLLILAKKSIKRQWICEFDKFTDIKNYMDEMVYIVEGADKRKRNKIYNEFKNLNSGILVTTYQSCLHDKDQIINVGFDTVIIDEAHILRAVDGKMNTAVKKSIAKCKYKMLLTGTPIMSRPKDLYALIGLCDKKYFGPFKDFEKKHILYLNKGRFTEEVGYRNLDELREKTQNVILRRTENEVDLQLPKVIENKISLPLDAVQIRLLDVISGKIRDNSFELDKTLEMIKRNPSVQGYKDKYAMLEGMNKGLLSCRQAIVNDPRLLLMSKSKMVTKLFKDAIPPTYTGSNKLDTTMNIIDNVLNANQKVIIFSKFERTGRLLKQVIEKTLKINVLTYNGEMNEKDRLDAIDLFTKDKNYNVLVGSDALAEGINCQEANHIINYDLPDTVAIKTQRMGRARRASSTFKRVYVYDLVVENSIDETIYAKLINQSNLFSGVVGLTEEESIAMKKVTN